MPVALFSERNIKPENINNLEITDHEAKRRIIENWQKGIVSGKILSQNEKKLQSEFLNKIFGDVLGYSYEKHLDSWQLENELKVNLDGRTPDGALGYFSFENGKITHQVFAVIELKGPLANLDKKQNRADFKGTPVEQAFSYVPKLDKPCPWVIVSNCREIRLYRYTLGMGQYESFNILELLQNGNFKRFCYLLQQGQLFLNVTDSPIERLFLEREKELKNITNEFYQRYKNLREKLFDQVRKNNPEIPAVDLLRCTQKLIDRLLFMCFVRDLDIVKNMIDAVNKAVNESFDQEEDALWKQLRFAFTALDKGYRKKNIPPFNGGLFRKDELLEDLVVKDFRLKEFMDFLNQYDYQNQLNINVLGHIFEQSISDIEGIKSRLQDKDPIFEGINENTAKAVTAKRKADGVFYTPEYITRYMVEQALGAYLDEAENQILATMNLTELPVLTVDDYKTVGCDNAGKSTNNDNITLHLNYWELYDDVLRKIKVIDPACGSGAFLTQVFDYLYERWKVLKTEVNRLTTPYEKALKELEALQKMGNNGFAETPFDEWNIKKNIIQNNLFGVDLNPESVEITKLSLWMKTANKKEKLADMDGNIKQGNSLIDDPKFSDAAFDWQTHFSAVFADGGFDIVVGNPPYLGGREWKEGFGRLQNFFLKNYEVADYQYDMYVLFWEKCIKLAKKETGMVSLITPNTWLNNQSNFKLRNFILENTYLTNIVDYTEVKVFEDAVVLPIVVTLKRAISKTSLTKLFKANKTLDIKYLSEINQQIWSDDELKIINIDIRKEDIAVRKKIEISSQKVIDLADVKFGVKIYETGKGKPKQTPDDAKNKIYEAGNQIDKSYRKFLEGKDIQSFEINWKKRWLKYGDNLAAKREASLFEGERILVRRIVGERLIGAYTNENYVTSQLLQIVKPHKPEIAKELLGILNSALMAYYFRKKYNRQEKTFPEIRIYELESLPIKLSDNQEISNKVGGLIDVNAKLKGLSEGFLSVVRSELKVEKINEKLGNWFSMTYEGFVSEIKKQRGGFKDLAQQMEWQGFFKENQLKAVALKEQINQTNAEIDELVFGLYGLSAGEIAIVRG